MPPRACRVSITDIQGGRHSTEVLAGSLFEAAVLGLSVLKKEGWCGDFGPATRLEVTVREPEVKHEVTVLQLQRWLDGASVSPAEQVKKLKLKQLIA